MHRFKLSLGLVILILLISVPVFGTIHKAQAIVVPTPASSVDELPYPGILPDNPLHQVKLARDKMVLMLTRDPIQKAHMLIKISQKGIASSMMIAKKGKTKMAVEVMSNVRAPLDESLSYLAEAKGQGNSPDSEVLNELKATIQKYQNSLVELAKIIPQGESGLTELLISAQELSKKASAL